MRFLVTKPKYTYLKNYNTLVHPEYINLDFPAPSVQNKQYNNILLNCQKWLQIKQNSKCSF